MAPESQAREKSSGVDGYGTDQSTNKLRRSRSSAFVVTVPNMVTPSSDSRVAVTHPATQKRQAEQSSKVDSVQSTKKGNPKKRSKPNKKKQATKNSSATVSLGLYGFSRTQDGGNSGCISREWDTTRGRKRGL
jgi:hypothetical protein